MAIAVERRQEKKSVPAVSNKDEIPDAQRVCIRREEAVRKTNNY